MSTIFLLAPIPTPSMSSSGSSKNSSAKSSSPSQDSYKSCSPLLHPAKPHHRPLHRLCIGFLKTVLWGLTALLVVVLFLSRPPMFTPGARSRKVATFEANLTLSQYIDSHFPLDLEGSQVPHLWITLADEGFASTGAANHDLFFKQLNLERRAYYGKIGIEVRDSALVILCMDEGCARECVKRDMYCYEGFEKTRPPEILPPTWPKLASLIELLPHRDVFFVDADVAIRQDPYPALEPLMERFDILMQENLAYSHGNTGFMWLRRGSTIAEAWHKVLEMDLVEQSRDQVNFNTVLGTTEARLQPGAVDGDGQPLINEFVAQNGLKVHILDARQFRIMHISEQIPWYERHDSLIFHATCADDFVIKNFLVKAQGYWGDIDQYYTNPPSLLSVETMTATEAEATQLFKILLALGHYIGRAVLPPLFVTVTDNPDFPSKAVRGPSAFPVAHLTSAFDIQVVEPRYIRHAQAHLLGQSTLDPKRGREDPGWTRMSRREKKAREDIAVSLTKTSEIDLRRYATFADLVARLLQPDLALSRHVELVNADQSPFWPWWPLDNLPVRHLQPCDNMTVAWECGEYCRGAEQLKQGLINEPWLPLKEMLPEREMVDAHVVPFSPRFLATPSTFRRRSSTTSTSTHSHHASSPLLPHPAPYSTHRPRRLVQSVLKGVLVTLAVVSSLTLIARAFTSGPKVYTRLPKVARAASNLTFTDYLEAHFPLNLDLSDSPHVWISLADYDFTGTGAANLDVFFKQLNVERKASYGKVGVKVRDTVLVTLCLDEGCAEECEKRDMYCYEGYERTRPTMIRVATWPKLASLIETLPRRDVFFIDSDVGFRQDPYPHLEPLMEQYDMLAQENLAFGHLNSGFLWMKRSTEMAQAWQSVLEMDLVADSRDQLNLNFVLDTTARRLQEGAELGDGSRLKDDFIASNGRRVHILDQRLFRIMHVLEGEPAFERHDSLIMHQTCADDKHVKIYMAKAQGYWNDVDAYYTQPPPLLSIENVAGTAGELSHFFKLFFAAAHYSGRAILPPTFLTVNDVPDSPSLARHSPSTFPLSHLERAFGIRVLEPEYIEHAQAHLLGQSTLDHRTTRDDKMWNSKSRKEQRRRTDIAVSLDRASEIDLRNYRTFYSLVTRLLQPDLASSPHIKLVNADRSPFWGTWLFDALPVDHIRTCEQLELPWQCDAFCRGVDELKQGPLNEDWPPLKDLNF
ncbi:hypothetical protein JCM11491_006933 [Sporobolomyces phaffii]